jgi:mannitol/fructose-specific phosphotransferase system IIA component
MCIVHAGFGGFRAFVARKKSQCKLIGNGFVIPHDTIHSPLATIITEISINSSILSIFV